jgi:hypothetical protein
MNRIVLTVLSVILLIIFLFTILPDYKQKEMSQQSAATLYVDERGQVTDAVVKLLGLTGVRITGDKLPSGRDWPEAKLWLKSRDLKEVVAAVQGKIDPLINWLGDAKKERWEEDPSKPKLQLPQAIQIINTSTATFKQSEQVLPNTEAKGVLFLGAVLSRVRMRLAFLNHLYDTKQLPRDLRVYVLTGERVLDEKIGETQSALMDSDNGIIPFKSEWKKSDTIINDEGHMIQLVFAQSLTPTVNIDRVIFVYSHKGEGRRATTESTVLQWLKDYSPSSGKYIAISNQPYVFYQEAVIRRTLLQAGRSDVQVQVVGPGKPAEMSQDDEVINLAKNLLNNLSRILYELGQIESLTK